MADPQHKTDHVDPLGDPFVTSRQQVTGQAAASAAQGGQRVESTGENALTRVELLGTLAALAAVMDSAPTGPPEPLVSARRKLVAALAGVDPGQAIATQFGAPASQHTTPEEGSE